MRRNYKSVLKFALWKIDILQLVVLTVFSYQRVS